MVFEEIAVNQFLQSFSSPALNLFFKAITEFGNPALWLFVAALLFWAGKEKKSFTVAAIVLLTGFFAGIFKMIIARPRPEGILAIEKDTGYSMPSGHATVITAFAAYGWLSREIKKNFKYLLIILVVLVGISRIYLGVHFLSDVLAGILLGAILGWFTFKLEAKIKKMHFHISKIGDEFLVVLFFVVVVLLYLFVPAEYYGAYGLFGYFVGYAIYKHTNITLPENQTKKQFTINLSIGTIIFGALGGIAYISTGIESQVLFFLAGLFITLIWPAIASKAIIRGATRKAKKS